METGTHGAGFGKARGHLAVLVVHEEDVLRLEVGVDEVLVVQDWQNTNESAGCEWDVQFVL